LQASKKEKKRREMVWKVKQVRYQEGQGESEAEKTQERAIKIGKRSDINAKSRGARLVRKGLLVYASHLTTIWLANSNF
jgi:hypothetical protein